MSDISQGLNALLDAMRAAGPVQPTAVGTSLFEQQYLAVFGNGPQAAPPPKNNFDLMIERKLEVDRNAYA